MKILKTWGLILIAGVLGACQGETVLAEKADLILTDGYIYTVDADKSVSEAIAIKENRILEIGDNEQILKLAGPDTQIRELGGRMVMPGLHDMHIHALGTVKPDMCDLESKPYSLDELVPVLKSCLVEFDIKDGEWLVVLQWTPFEGNAPSERHPTMRAALDAVSTTHPIILWGNDGHHGAANSVALDIPSPPLNAETLKTVYKEYASYVALDDNGELSGGLMEDARKLVRQDMHGDMLGAASPPSKLMPRVATRLAERGITTIQDAAVSALELKQYLWLDQSGKLKFRLRTALLQPMEINGDADGLNAVSEAIAELEALRESANQSEHIVADAVKLFADGVMEGNPRAEPPTIPNAAMIDGYRQPIFFDDKETGQLDIAGYVDFDSDVCVSVRDATDPIDPAAFKEENGFFPGQCTKRYGKLEYPPLVIEAFVQQAVDAGFHVHVHAIADQAVRVTTDAFEKAMPAADAKGLTLSMAHLQIGKSEDVQRLGKLGAYVVFTYLWAMPERPYETMVIPFVDKVEGASDLYNPDHYYMTNAYPFRSFNEAGGALVFGSDAPVGSRDPRPFSSLEIALTRKGPDGVVLNAGERIDIHEAIASYTLNSARLMTHDKDVGSLEPGKVADLIVLDQNIVKLAENGKADDISDTKVLLTMFDGEVIYDTMQ